MWTNLRNGAYALSGLFIAQDEMGDTSELYKSDDSLPRQTHTHTHTHTHTQWPC